MFMMVQLYHCMRHTSQAGHTLWDCTVHLLFTASTMGDAMSAADDCICIFLSWVASSCLAAACFCNMWALNPGLVSTVRIAIGVLKQTDV